VAAAHATTTPPESELLKNARSGDEGAYQLLVEPYRRELHAHCYQMLGSVHDAEDALQDALIRAWRGLRKFEGRSSVRSWLYRIATNASLDFIGKRPKRILPLDHGPPSDPHDGPGEPLVESVWVEPYPDETLGIEDGFASPEATYERRESVELAFVAALQHLPPSQRAVLILREVLGFSAKEVAETLESSTQSVNSALQRARQAVDEKLPEETQQATLRAIGDEELQKIVEAYMVAMEAGDVEKVISLLTDDAAWSMPPLARWYRGKDVLFDFLRLGPLSGAWRWKRLAARANGQPAIAGYIWEDDQQAFMPFALDVLSFRGNKIADVTAFINRTTDVTDPEDFRRWPDQAAVAERTIAVFERFGLPARIPATD
jgi:RNA polymerase sigma-70 factor (ECF subfamily)